MLEINSAWNIQNSKNLNNLINLGLILRNNFVSAELAAICIDENVVHS